jgi:hypothetical protein
VNAVFSKDGFGRLRFAWLILAVSIVAAVASAWGSRLYLDKEKRDGIASTRMLAEAQARVDAARREREDLKASAELFKDLVDRGILREESRLDFFERLENLKAKHRIMDLEFEIAPQRALPLPGGRVFNAVDVLGSRVKIRVQALHEGDALAFLEDLARPPKGFNPVSRCALRRIESGASSTPMARIEAECALEWISLKDKRGSRAN